MTAVEAEEALGAKYFYRQKTYRYEKAKKLRAFQFRAQQCFLRDMLVGVYMDELEQKIASQFPELQGYRVYYDQDSRRVMVDGLFGRYVAVETDKETEDDLLTKLKNIAEWMAVAGQEEEDSTPAGDEHTGEDTVDKAVTTPGDKSLSTESVFPDEIQFVRIDTDQIEGVNVKSFILISLPSIAQFIGVKTDQFSEWVQKTTFSEFIVSTHPSKIRGPEISGPFQKGFVKGYSPLLPLELVPELIVAFRQSGRRPEFPGRAEQLYMLAKSTLEAVGLAISGNEDKAATELARVSEGLGVSAADQVIEIFKRYESRPFQVKTNLKFRGKVKNEGKDYKFVTGRITIGVTGKPASAWLALGKINRLPAKARTSGREVMRTISPADSVGVAFSESHYIKDSSNMDEVIKTGVQGKDFYKRLKDVGLLDN
jgi:hypothetical protein